MNKRVRKQAKHPLLSGPTNLFRNKDKNTREKSQSQNPSRVRVEIRTIPVLSVCLSSQLVSQL